MCEVNADTLVLLSVALVTLVTLNDFPMIFQLLAVFFNRWDVSFGVNWA